MENDIETIFSKQAEVLPGEVRQFVASGSWEGQLGGITAHYNLSEDDTDSLRTEIALVLAGLVHPNEFRSALGGEIQDVDSATLNALATEVGVGIFAPIRPALEQFFAEQEEAEKEVKSKAEKKTTITPSLSATQTPIVARSLERMPDIAPDNLPTGEEEVESRKSKVESGEEAPLIPPLKPKMRPADDAEEVKSQKSKVESEGTHPFEEKMKKVFTGGTADMGELALSPTPPSQTTTSRVINDPYREPVE